MTIAFVADATPVYATGVGAKTSASIDSTSANFVAGIVCAVGTPSIASDSKGNTLTACTGYSNVVTVANIFYCANAVVGSGHTITTNSLTVPVVWFGAFSGVKTTSPLDQQANVANAGNNSAAVSNAMNVTPSEDGELLLYDVTDIWSGPITALNTGTLLSGIGSDAGLTHLGMFPAYEIQTTATARGPIFTQAATERYNGTLASFKAAAAGGGEVVSIRKRGAQLGSGAFFSGGGSQIGL